MTGGAQKSAGGAELAGMANRAGMTGRAGITIAAHEWRMKGGCKAGMADAGMAAKKFLNVQKEFSFPCGYYMAVVFQFGAFAGDI